MAVTLARRINPSLLIWAREQQGISVDFAVAKGFPKLSLWEAGAELPTMPQLRDLAHLYRRPSALFFMSAAPRPERARRDYRRHQASGSGALSPEARTEIRVCESRRDKALELATLLGEPTLFGLEAIRQGADIEAAAARLRTALGIDETRLSALKKDKDALDYWISRIEAQNVLVFRSITLSSFGTSYKEIRGSSEYYEDYPWVLLNSQESERAQLFTLGHELAHLLLRETGICDLDEEEGGDRRSIESFCNYFSAALLMPRSEIEPLVGVLSTNKMDKTTLEGIVYEVSKAFHVSNEAAARRLLSLGYAERSFYLAVREEQIETLDLERKEAKEKEKGGGGQFYHRRIMAWNGRTLCGLALGAYHADRISLTEAAETLRTKTEHLESIERELY
jgi:Zn-dependent peptidase ImmA (M78 family)